MSIVRPAEPLDADAIASRPTNNDALVIQPLRVEASPSAAL
ncbi:hypothetical protein [Oculatella sp. LEGE 06141]|nr:hypothetical protein [Oculatella sp. LEGE 06141]